MTARDNVTPAPHARPRGNTRQYALTRLERDAPALYARVVAGELSAHQAAISAGFRRKLPPDAQAVRALAKLSDAEWRVIARWEDEVRGIALR